MDDQDDIRAYHGTPHDFDRFDLSKVGTGIGQQAYGHGLYFASDEDVAKTYRDDLSRGAHVIDDRPVTDLAREALVSGEPSPVQRIAQYVAQYGRMARNALSAREPHLLDQYDEMAASQRLKPAGKMYEVRIKAHPDTMLDWDRPILEQPAIVKMLQEQHANLDPNNEKFNFLDNAHKNIMNGKSNGSHAHFYLKMALGNEGASQYLNGLGIKGIKYQDKGTRGVGEGTTNYVIFDDSLVNIARKYRKGGFVTAKAAGGQIDDDGGRYERRQEGPFYQLSRKGIAGDGRVSEGLRREVREAAAALPAGGGAAGVGDPQLSEAGPSPRVGNRVESLARDYIQQVHGRDLIAPKLESSLAKQSAIGRSFAEAAKGTPEYKSAIFDAYTRMMPEVVEQSGATNYDQLLERAYRQMAAETSQQFERLPFRMSFHRAGEGDYKSSKHMLDDLHNNNHLYVFQGGDRHEFLHNVDPETGLNENEKFRAVHDVFGHGIYGNPFGAKGEENAWGVHSQMYSPLARLAMTAETRGQNSFVNYTPINAALKEKIAEAEERIADARRNRNEFALEMAQRKKNLLFKEFQFAPQKAVLLPPEFLSPEYQGGMPDYVRKIIRPEQGTGFSSALTHYSTIPDMAQTDPSRYGTGIPGDEASRLRSRPGGVKERSYFYLGEPEAVTPEEGLGPYRYRAQAENLYDITKDPLNLKTLARESNRTPWTSNFNPGTIEPGQFANDLERMVKEHGYTGFANPNAAFPMAVTFDPTQVERRAPGGPAVATLRRMSDPAVNEAIRVINRSGSSPRDAVTLSKRLLGRQ